MSTESKTAATLTFDEENSILFEIFQYLEPKDEDIIATLRIALVGQDNSAKKVVERYIRETFSYDLVKNAADNSKKQIPEHSFTRIKKAVENSLINMVRKENFTGAHIGDFYKNIARAFTETTAISQSTEEFIFQKGRRIRKVIATIMPDFWDKHSNRERIFNNFWDKEISAFTTELRFGSKAFRKELSWLIFFLGVVSVIGFSFFLNKPSSTPILGTAVGCAMVFIGHMVVINERLHRFHLGTNANAVALSEILNKETALFAFQHIVRKIKPNQTELELELVLAPLPKLEEIRAAAATTSATRNTSTCGNNTIKDAKKVFNNQRNWTDINLATQSTPASPSSVAHPTVDLSRELGHSACYCGNDKEEKNTLFRFQASAAPTDARYVFINPQLKEQLGEVQWTKFMAVARHARLASKTNQQGIKTLNFHIKDPKTGKDYAAVELKILGVEGSGEVRLLGTMIPITLADGKKYNVYIFNTLWDKGAVPESFSYPLCSPIESTTPSSSLSSSTTQNRDRFLGRLPPTATAPSPQVVSPRKQGM